jgi:4-hydroxy-tetrahydrodipicolinate synthase
VLTSLLKRRGILTSDAQRKPGTALSPTARAEVDYLIARLARADRRAEVGARMSLAS